MNTFSPEVEQFFKELVMHKSIPVTIGTASYLFTRSDGVKPLFKARANAGDTLYIYQADNKLYRYEIYEVYAGEFHVNGVIFLGYAYDIVEMGVPPYYDMGQSFHFAYTPEEAKEIQLNFIRRNIGMCEDNINDYEQALNHFKMSREKVEAEFAARVEEFKEEDQQDIIDDEFDNADGSPAEYHGYVSDSKKDAL